MTTDFPQTVDITYGSTKYGDVSSSIFVGKLEKPFKRESAATTGVIVRGSESSVQAGRFDHQGYLMSKKVQHKNGAILLVQVSWKRRGIGIRDATIFVRLREGGPMISILAKLPPHQDNRAGPETQTFLGCGDIMTLDDLRTAGFDMPAHYRNNYMDVEEIRECFTLRQIRPETKPRPALVAVSTSTGVEFQEMAVAPRRRLLLGRKRVT